MDSFQFLLLAERLLQTDSHPAGNRSAISRAYYAAYHRAREFVESAGIHLKRGQDSHVDVSMHLTSIGDPEIEQIGKELADLRAERNTADYDLSDRLPEGASTASSIVVQARELIEAIRECRGDAVRYEAVKRAIHSRHHFLRGFGGTQ
jgi:uncharacterized protein (UPF0332 family)